MEYKQIVFSTLKVMEMSVTFLLYKAKNKPFSICKNDTLYNFAGKTKTEFTRKKVTTSLLKVKLKEKRY